MPSDTNTQDAPVNDVSTKGPGRDVLAGLTIWAVLVPSALAYSSLAGVEPQVGLIGVPLALLGYGLFGSSKIVVVGADAAVSVLVGSAMAAVGGADNGAIAILSGLVGIIYLMLRLARMGWIADLVPKPVLKGFVQGLSIATIIGQLPKLLAVNVDDGANSFADVWNLINGLSNGLGPGAGLGIGALAVLLVLTRFVPSLPSAMLVLGATMVLVWAFELADDGVAVVGVPGPLFADLGATSFDFSVTSALLPAALAIVVLGFTESLGAAALVSDHNGERTEPNRELLGLGAANLAVAFGGSYAVTGALSKTAVAVSSGAQTRLANGVVAIGAVLAALFGRPLFAYMSNAVLAAVVIWAMIGMIDLAYLRWLKRASLTEFWVAMAAFVGVLVFGVMQAVVVATILALALLAHHVSRPPIDLMGRSPDGSWHALESGQGAQCPEGLVIVRFDGPLVFLSARYLADRLLKLDDDPNTEVLVLDASAITAIDTTAVSTVGQALSQLSRNQPLWITGADDRITAVHARIADPDSVLLFPDRNAALEQYRADRPAS